MIINNDEGIVLIAETGKLLYCDGIYAETVHLGIEDSVDRWVEVDNDDL